MSNIHHFDNYFYIHNRQEYQEAELTGPHLDYLGPYATEDDALNALDSWEKHLTEVQNGNRS